MEVRDVDDAEEHRAQLRAGRRVRGNDSRRSTGERRQRRRCR